jgi:hypothetical protein
MNCEYLLAGSLGFQWIVAQWSPATDELLLKFWWEGQHMNLALMNKKTLSTVFMSTCTYKCTSVFWLHLLNFVVLSFDFWEGNTMYMYMCKKIILVQVFIKSLTSESCDHYVMTMLLLWSVIPPQIAVAYREQVTNWTIFWMSGACS